MQEELWPGNWMRAGASGTEHGDDIAIAIFPEVHYGVLSSLALAAPCPQGYSLNACLRCQGKSILAPQHVEM